MVLKPERRERRSEPGRRSTDVAKSLPGVAIVQADDAGRGLGDAQDRLDTLVSRLSQEGVSSAELRHQLAELSQAFAKVVVRASGGATDDGPRFVEGQGQGYVVTQRDSSLRDDARQLLHAVDDKLDLKSALDYLPDGASTNEQRS